jgi:hypothetical protein
VFEHCSRFAAYTWSELYASSIALSQLCVAWQVAQPEDCDNQDHLVAMLVANTLSIAWMSAL